MATPANPDNSRLLVGGLFFLLAAAVIAAIAAAADKGKSPFRKPE